MPIQGGKYVSPNWQNGGPPAIDAEELNAMSDKLEELDGTTFGNGLSFASGTVSAKLSTQSNNDLSFGADGGLYSPPYTQGNGITISGRQISARLSTAQGNTLSLGSDGGIFAPESGKRYARVVVGTSASGWTSQDCDYLCTGTGDETTIQSAIASLPSGGGEVVLLDGTYNISSASISITGNNISIKGNGSATTLKAASELNAPLLNITGSDCLIRGLVVDGNTGNTNDIFGIVVGSASAPANDCVIVQVTVQNFRGGGVEILNGADISIRSNTFSNCDIGIALNVDATGLTINGTISGNTFSNCYYGVGQPDSTGTPSAPVEMDLLIYGNLVDYPSAKSGYGIRLSYVSGLSVVANTFSGYPIGVSIQNTGGLCIGDNVFQTTLRGVVLASCTGASISGNMCSDNNQGIRIVGPSSHIAISGNVCDSGTNGIYLGGQVTDISVAGNTCNGNSDSGIQVYVNTADTTASDLSITGNTCSGNGSYGIELNCSNSSGQITNCIVSGNITTENQDHGIFLSRVQDSSVTGNTSSGNTDDGGHACGIYLNTNCNSNVISGNQLSENASSGIQINSGNMCVIAGNFFTGGYTGIHTQGAQYLTVTGNLFVGYTASADDAISLGASSQNCLVSSNNLVGQSVANSGSNNTIENNKTS